MLYACPSPVLMTLLLITSWPWKNGETHAHLFFWFLQHHLAPRDIHIIVTSTSHYNLLQPQSRTDAQHCSCWQTLGQGVNWWGNKQRASRWSRLCCALEMVGCSGGKMEGARGFGKQDSIRTVFNHLMRVVMSASPESKYLSQNLKIESATSCCSPLDMTWQ